MAFKILGITDEKTECECCGKTNLKCTVALDCVDAEGNETGSITYYGRDCASKAIRGDNNASSVKIIESEARGICPQVAQQDACPHCVGCGECLPCPLLPSVGDR